MRTNIVIDDEMMAQAQDMTGLRTKKDVVDRALQLLVQIERQKQLRDLRGKVRWTGAEPPSPAA